MRGLHSGNDIRVVQVARFLQGAVASTGSIMVGGTIADIWSPEQYGPSFLLSSQSSAKLTSTPLQT